MPGARVDNVLRDDLPFHGFCSRELPQFDFEACQVGMLNRRIVKRLVDTHFERQ